MKKIDAYWEMRNLGKNVLELNFDKHDSKDSIYQLTSEFETYDYLIAKVPNGRLDLVHSLEDKGFRFMETQIELEYLVNKKREPSKYIQKMANQYQYKKIDALEELDVFLAKIEEDLFVTDRVSLDPLFNRKIAHKRYLNWLTDAFHSGKSSIYEVEVKSQSVGFFCFTDIDSSTCYGVLAGVYKEYLQSGLGLIVAESSFKCVRELGYSKIVTRVSSNNMEALRVNVNQGYVCKDMYYILRKANFSE